jgi:3-methylcrotonyl-CoA carboxylase alpha subunit
MRHGIFTVRHGDVAHRVTVAPGGQVRIDDGATFHVSSPADRAYAVSDGDRAWQVFVTGSGDRRQVFVDGEVYELAAGTESTGHARPARGGTELLSAPMPARVTAIAVEPGRAVRKGDVLLKLEAMKMEIAVRAPRDGTVVRMACRVGELVQPGVVLLEVA